MPGYDPCCGDRGRTPVDIGDLGGGWAEPVQITDDGTVIGHSSTAGYSAAAAINDRAQILGYRGDVAGAVEPAPGALSD